MSRYNPLFKPPASPPTRPMRSPSPPRAFVEPLSPAKPAPIEPNFNYPPLNGVVDTPAGKNKHKSHTKTPKSRQRSSSHKSGHHRTPSTIDALAEAALAVSPSFQSVERSTANHEHIVQFGVGTHGGSEPPHKRTRSELLPTPFAVQYASRPATSYSGVNGWHQGPVHHSASRNGYERRVEEAALLLNFRTGGWPGNDTTLGAGASGVSRPHANSFPQDSHHPWQHPDLKENHQLLPAFSPYTAVVADPMVKVPGPALPSPQQTSDESGASPGPRVGIIHEDVVPDTPAAHPLPVGVDVEMKDAPQQTQTPPDETESEVCSVATNPAVDAPEVVTKSKRGWPKGKPRGSTGRRAEKSASKKSSISRKKALDASKRGKGDDALDHAKDPKASPPRRKSFGDITRQEDLHIGMDIPATQRSRSVPPDTLMVLHGASALRPTRRSNKVAADTICAGCATMRDGANGELDDWISCNGCKKWFHVDCAGFRKAHEVRDVDKFFCAPCETEHGKTTYVRKSTRAHASVDYAELQRGVLKTSEESNEHHYIQPIKDGTFQFDPETFPRMRPEMVTKDFFERGNVFVEPICIPAAFNPRPWSREQRVKGEGEAATLGSQDCPASDMLADDFEYEAVPDQGQDSLDMVMPQDLTVRQVCHLVGPDTPLDVIDVKTQNSGSKWTLGRWADYYEEDSEDKAIRNVISLEVSQSKLGRLLRRPKIVRDIDLQDDVWPKKDFEQGKYPKVQFYCLMSVADSYTDFHIDFGGSSVYYHILKGKKTFFFIPPKAKHLKAYEEWNDSPQQNYTFLPHITKECYRVDLSEGDTMLIPSGWIHAVWTPETSLVIGGNFLNRMSYRNQFKVVDIEKANETPMKFRYPFFQKIMWYTAIKYLQDDPLPPAVSQLFHDGKQFGREQPVWADFDGSIAEDDARPGAHNARYYSQAEIDGLPELVNFIFRTVMLVMGRVEGMSADRMKRVNASIPKGHGEPLEVAKTFALWVAWKRGNEDPPAWAHPDAVLPNSKEEGPPKKLSARALKEMERKEAIAAYRVAPDRQSARVKNAAAAAAAASAMAGTDVATNGGVATPERVSSTGAPQRHGIHQNPSHAPPLLMKHDSQHRQNHHHPVLSPTQVQYHPQPADNAFPSPQPYPHGLPGHHLSTPKTSVLGPKRVACDACRKRRIRCKHKDMVIQAAQSNGVGFQRTALADSPFQQSDVYDNITVTPPKSRDEYNHFANAVDDQQTHNGHATPNGSLDASGQGPLPGTNAYVNANIPMTMNGVSMFGDMPKRGRSKACFECRKSKRRCVHDEHGNVDPIKAAETPVPRGSWPARKRSSGEDGTPQARKKPRLNDTPNGSDHSPSNHRHPHHHHQTPSSEPPQHAYMSAHSSYQPAGPDSHSSSHEQSVSTHGMNLQPAIDPSLFSMHIQPTNHTTYHDHQYPYDNMQTLEQIASEVLDIDGHDHQEPNDQQPNGHAKEPADPHDTPNDDKPEAFSGPATDIDSSHPLAEIVRANNEMSNGIKHRPTSNHIPSSTNPPPTRTDTTEEKDPPESGHAAPQPSIEAPPPATASPPPSAAPAAPKTGISSLPLYRPPPPLSQSPELSKRAPHRPSASPVAPAVGDVKAENAQGPTSPPPPTATELKSLELAKALQQEDLGLRRRN